MQEMSVQNKPSTQWLGLHGISQPWCYFCSGLQNSLLQRGRAPLGTASPKSPHTMPGALSDPKLQYSKMYPVVVLHPQGCLQCMLRAAECQRMGSWSRLLTSVPTEAVLLRPEVPWACLVSPSGMDSLAFSIWNVHGTSGFIKHPGSRGNHEDECHEAITRQDGREHRASQDP